MADRTGNIYALANVGRQIVETLANMQQLRWKFALEKARMSREERLMMDEREFQRRLAEQQAKREESLARQQILGQLLSRGSVPQEEAEKFVTGEIKWPSFSPYPRTEQFASRIGSLTKPVDKDLLVKLAEANGKNEIADAIKKYKGKTIPPTIANTLIKQFDPNKITSSVISVLQKVSDINQQQQLMQLLRREEQQPSSIEAMTQYFLPLFLQQMIGQYLEKMGGGGQGGGTPPGNNSGEAAEALKAILKELEK